MLCVAPPFCSSAVGSFSGCVIGSFYGIGIWLPRSVSFGTASILHGYYYSRNAAAVLCIAAVGVESPCETPSLRSFKDASLVRSLASGFLILFCLALKASFMIITTPTMLLFVYCCCNRVVVGIESRHDMFKHLAPRGFVGVSMLYSFPYISSN